MASMIYFDALGLTLIAARPKGESAQVVLVIAPPSRASQWPQRYAMIDRHLMWLPVVRDIKHCLACAGAELARPSLQPVLSGGAAGQREATTREVARLLQFAAHMRALPGRTRQTSAFINFSSLLFLALLSFVCLPAILLVCLLWVAEPNRQLQLGSYKLRQCRGLHEQLKRKKLNYNG